VIDLLGETDEDLTFYCIHDADAAGTMIYQGLQEATRARPARKVRIINLGLEAPEATEMDLEVEKIVREKEYAEKTWRPVADYVEDDWAEWYQDHRIELNAMTSRQFLDWLDAKFEDQVGKLIPPAEVAADHLERCVRAKLERSIIDELIREARVKERVEAEYQARRGRVESLSASLPEMIDQAFKEDDTLRWTAPVEEIAAEGGS
jgi:hypothetical protein